MVVGDVGVCMVCGEEERNGGTGFRSDSKNHFEGMVDDCATMMGLSSNAHEYVMN